MGAEKRNRFDANRPLEELLDDPEVRAHYQSLHVFFGEREFGRLVVLLRGYDYALLDFIPERSLFDGFQEWMVMRHHLDPSRPWEYWIIERYGDGVEAIPKFLALWDDFRSERSEKGLRSLLEEFHEYDIARFGGPTIRRDRPYLK